MSEKAVTIVKGAIEGKDKDVAELVIDANRDILSDKERSDLKTHVQTSFISKHEMIDQINDQDWKVAQQKSNVKTTEEMVTDEIESMPEFKLMEEAQKTFDAAKERFRIASLGNGKLNNLKDSLAHEKRELKERREILSSLIVRYMADYRVQSVEAHDAPRKLVVTARIGGKLKKDQMELPL